MTLPCAPLDPPAPPADVPDAAPEALPWWRQPALWVAVGLAAALAGSVLYARRLRPDDGPVRYETAAVRRGGLAMSFTANGALQPGRAVNLASDLPGTVSRVLVEVNDPVRRGQVLVQLDTALLEDRIARSRAALAAARASLAQGDATLDEARSMLARLQEVARLSGGQVPSQAELDGGRAALARAEAGWLAAAAGVRSAQAALSSDRGSLARATIRSPIDGFVLSRSVEPGSAVGASQQAAPLLGLADDLRRLRLRVNVGEADVGLARVGQRATFSVSSYPERRYPATIARIAYGATLSENKVSYVAELEVDNTELTLRPGMTAVATVRVAERASALLVPNSALRYMPEAAAAAAAAAAARAGTASLLQRAGAGGPGQRTLWVLRDGVAQPVPVTLGISDGRNSEVLAGALREGMQVILYQRPAP